MVGDNSRYMRTTLYSRDDEFPMLAIREKFKFDPSNCTFHRWTLGDSLDKLAYKYYDNAELRWAILDANPTLRSEFEIKINDVILIPDIEDILNILDEDYEEANNGYIDEYDAYDDYDSDDYEEE